MSTEPETAQTVDRAMAVLEIIAMRGACRLADVVSGSGLERRIVGRLLGSLRAAGLIEYTDAGRYELGTRLIDLGELAERRNGLRARARPVAQQLMRVAGATTIVHRVQRHDLVPLLVCMPTDVVAVGYPPGRRIALHEGTGRAVLAWLPPSEIQSVLADAGSSLDQDGWPAQLEDIRRTKIFVSYGEVIRGITAVGSAIRRADGYPVAALVLVASEGTHPERFAQEVVQAAAVLSDFPRVPATTFAAPN